MATFTDKELEYLRSQRLARLATADLHGAPHVVPLRFRVSADATAIEVGGRNFGSSRKYRDMRANPRVAIVVDDLASVSPGSRVASRFGGRLSYRMEEMARCRISPGRASRPSGS